MLRREFNLALASWVAVSGAGGRAQASAVGTPDSERPPFFWVISRGDARVYLAGFAGAPAGDVSWFAPMQKGFDESSELWLEVSPARPWDKGDPALEELRHEQGRTFFDALEPSTRARVRAIMTRLSIKQEEVEKLRPWAAYYVIARAYWEQSKNVRQELNTGEFISGLAAKQNKAVHWELPTRLDEFRSFASMSDKAQSQYIDWLLDYCEDEDKGINKDELAWRNGAPTANWRNLNRMRSQYPELYHFMQPMRNLWWSQKISGFLTKGGSYFIGIGMLHVLGPDGIPATLLKHGFVPAEHLRKATPSA